MEKRRQYEHFVVKLTSILVSNMAFSAFEILKLAYQNSKNEEIGEIRLIKVYQGKISQKCLKMAFNQIRKSAYRKNDIRTQSSLLAISSALKSLHIMRLTQSFGKMKANYVESKIQEKYSEILKQEKKEIKSIRAQLTQ